MLDRTLRSAVLLSLSLLAGTFGCKEVPHGGVRAGGVPVGEASGPTRPPGPQVVRRVAAVELIPADLDLVVRVDLARMRLQLGAEAIDRLFARAVVEAGPGAEVDPLLVLATRRADVVWIGLRASDPASGDRVVVVEGQLAGLRPDPARFRPGPPSIVAGVVQLDRAGAVPRDGTARVVAIGERALAFVSPVEVDAVERVLRDGPDSKRGDPSAEGLVSADLRVRRLAPDLERRFPSLGAVVAGVDRVRGTAVLLDDGLRVDLEVLGASQPGAERLLAFVLALRDGAAESDRAKVLATLSAERIDKTVRLRWTLPGRAMLTALGEGAGP